MADDGCNNRSAAKRSGRAAGLGGRDINDVRRVRASGAGSPRKPAADADGGGSPEDFEGMAGQAVTATAAVALVTSLLITVVTRRIDRRLVLLGLSVLLIFSNLLVAMASNLAMLLAGRVLLGVALGGFWTLSAATMMRLVPRPSYRRPCRSCSSAFQRRTVSPRRSGVMSGISSAGGMSFWALPCSVHWRSSCSLRLRCASLPPRGHSRFGTLVEVLTRPGVGFAMVAILLVFTGHFAFFTYIRPFLETVTGLGVEASRPFCSASALPPSSATISAPCCWNAPCASR